ncbi:MAG: sigma-54-dependent Fis family transcriptional regulator [Ectothiorhodospiraceae bacterium]|nr:sigma-54-dependent Fis family transcriptional regulator [Ectothiorhodospiraceae bacterium]
MPASDTRVLIIDDEASFVRSLVFALREEGIQARGVHTGEDGLRQAREEPPDLVLLDLRLPGMDGMQVLEALSGELPEIPVVMISAHGDTRAAVQAVKGGAADYLTKPFALDELFHLISSTRDRQRMRSELSYLRDRSAPSAGLIGSGPAMRALWSTLHRVAASSTGRILLQGESGTGKALVARAIHAESARRDGPFLEINCAALPEQLIETELFGAEKGAYTGAHRRRNGLVALADGGTLFLDEIGELPITLQAKLLHFLENGDYRPVGAGANRMADVRVVAATNRSLETEVREGRFREDLYYRLNVIEITLPPLRERGEDILELANRFAESQAVEENCRPIRFSTGTQERLLHYGWPGNVRELKNLVERLTILYPGHVVEPSLLPQEFHGSSSPGEQQLEGRLAETERELLMDALQRTDGHKGQAAELLGISRHALKRRLARLGLR